MVNRKTPSQSRDGQNSSLTSVDTNDSFYTEDNSSAKRPRIDGDEDAYPSPGSETPNESDLERIGRGVKDLIRTINKLEVVGIEEIGLSLPRIVAVGDQSAGKSSLIEAISDIRVPRSNNTCTRCPIHITLEGSDSEEWICDVSLLKKYDYYSRSKHVWQLKDTPETTPFVTVRDKTQLGPVIQAAQQAILNPSKNPLTYVNGDSGNNAIEVEFSKNVVNLAIRGPRLPNLSFYDLPGIINQVENSRDAHLIDMVKELVVEHISSPEAIVLLACSMESDIANCNAARVIREAGADNRCLCVLTKPDRYPQSEPYDHWKAILEGRKFPFKHGYHVVKNLGQNDLEKYSHDQARKLETDFFSKSTPWHTPAFRKFGSQFGISNLQTKLSDLLASHIKKCLPQIRQQIDEQLDVVEDDLSKLPEPPSDNPSWVVVKMLQTFYSRFQACIDGEDPDLKKEWEELIEKFASELALRKPGIKVQTQDENERKQRAKELPINVDPPEEDEPQTPTPASRSRRLPTVAPASGGSAASVATAAFPPPRSTLTPRNTGPVAGKMTFTLDNVRERLDKRAASFIGRFEHPKAVEAMIQESQQGWKMPLDNFTLETKRLLEDRVDSLIQELIHDRDNTELARALPECAQEYLHTAFDNLDTAIARDLRSELIRPMIHTTFNREILSSKEAEELKTISSARIRVRQELYWDETEPECGKVTRGLEREKKLAKAELDRDPFEHEVIVMSKVRAYYLVACHRLVDTTARTIFNELFEPAKEKLYKYICDTLGVYSNNAASACQRLLADDPDREAERQRLKQQHDKLADAKRQLQELA